MAAQFGHHFMTPDGQVLDPENHGISHSEGQAYAMMISLNADDHHSFDIIWSWTKENLRRPDGLHAWKYVPGVGVTDTNNATDADLIIAAVLSAAAKRWDRGDYLEAAVETAHALGDAVLTWHDGHVLMLPAEEGFDARDQPDGPVVNLSYYHFDMMLMVADLAPRHAWREAVETGWMLYRRVLSEREPGDWTSVADPHNPMPAAHFPRKSSYDAIRAPINMLSVPFAWRSEYLDIVDARHARYGGTPGIVNLDNGRRTKDLTDSGYLLIAAGVQCVASGAPIPRELFYFEPATYFSSALHLIVIHQLYLKHPHCIPA